MKPPYDAALVLGVELGANDAPTDELARRVTAAAEVYHRGACAKLVLCGGKLPGHRLAEADVMARMMTALGVSEEALILEDQSQDTLVTPQLHSLVCWMVWKLVRMVRVSVDSML